MKKANEAKGGILASENGKTVEKIATYGTGLLRIWFTDGSKLQIAAGRGRFQTPVLEINAIPAPKKKQKQKANVSAVTGSFDMLGPEHKIERLRITLQDVIRELFNDNTTESIGRLNDAVKLLE